MEVKRVIVGPLQTNCYLIIKQNNCLIVDPGDDADKIKDTIGNKKPIGILITHHHFDHVGALNELKTYYKTDVYDYHNLKEPNKIIKEFNFEVINTPGHTNDSITYYFKNEKIMFVGDFIFKGTIGRTDLPTGDINTMKNSLTKIKKYDKDITIYPGHGEKTCLAYELQNNYFLSGINYE